MAKARVHTGIETPSDDEGALIPLGAHRCHPFPGSFPKPLILIGLTLIFVALAMGRMTFLAFMRTRFSPFCRNAWHLWAPVVPVAPIGAKTFGYTLATTQLPKGCASRPEILLLARSIVSARAGCT